MASEKENLKIEKVLNMAEEEDKKALPMYSKGEELINAITHIVGGAFFIVGAVLCMVFANSAINIWGRVSLLVYCASVFIMFAMSAIYHFLNRNKGKRVFRVFDHCAIFLAIAGTYTPLCFITLGGTLWGVLIGIFVWVLAILGIVLNSVNMYKKSIKVFSMLAYLGMGWCIVIAIIPLLQAWCLNGFLWLLAGGLLYSIGAVFYGLGKNKKYMHSLWHFFVLFGAILQFIAIFVYVVL